jgi:hypothetical protein
MPGRQRERHRTGQMGWLRAAVLGANDGILSTASLVSGVAAAHGTHSSVVATASVLKSAGPEESAGVIAATSFKTVGDPQWANDLDYQAWLAFMRTYYPGDDVATDSLCRLFQCDALRRSPAPLRRRSHARAADDGRHASRPHAVAAARHHPEHRPIRYNPIKQMQLQRFDGH